MSQVDIADRLLSGFNSESGVPYSDVNLATRTATKPKWGPDSSTSEVTTIQLEFRDLSTSTGNPVYAVSNLKYMCTIINVYMACQKFAWQLYTNWLPIDNDWWEGMIIVRVVENVPCFRSLRRARWLWRCGFVVTAKVPESLQLTYNIKTVSAGCCRPRGSARARTDEAGWTRAHLHQRPEWQVATTFHRHSRCPRRHLLRVPLETVAPGRTKRTVVGV